LDRFPDDPNAGDSHEAGFEECREVLNFAVSVGMVFIGGLVGDANREEGEGRACEIEAGVSGV